MCIVMWATIWIISEWNIIKFIIVMSIYNLNILSLYNLIR